MARLGKALASMPHLCDLTLAELQLSDGDNTEFEIAFGELGLAVARKNALTRLCVYDTVRQMPEPACAAMLGSLRKLKRLDASSEDGKWRHVVQLSEMAPSLGLLTQLQYLNISHHEHASSAVGRQLSKLRSLKVLVLGEAFHVGTFEADRAEGHAACIAAAAPGLSALQQLHMTGLLLSDAAVKVLCAGLAQLKALRKLSLATHKFGAGGATALAQVLADLSELRMLDIGDAQGKFGAAGMRALAPGLKAAPALEALRVDDTGVDGSAFEEILGACAEGGTPLKYLHASSNGIAAKAVAAALKRHAQQLPGLCELRVTLGYSVAETHAIKAAWQAGIHDGVVAAPGMGIFLTEGRVGLSMESLWRGALDAGSQPFGFEPL